MHLAKKIKNFCILLNILSLLSLGTMSIFSIINFKKEIIVISYLNIFFFFCRFTVHLGNLEVFCNDNHTRTFIGFIAQPLDILSQCVTQLDSVLSDYNLPKYYEVSILCVPNYYF